MPDPNARLKELTEALEGQSQQLEIAQANVRELATSIEQLRGAIALCNEFVENGDVEDGEGDSE